MIPIAGLLLSVMATEVSAKENTNKIVYLEIEGEQNDQASVFAGLIIEDKIESPKISFESNPQPPPKNEISLSTSLRKYITTHERENYKSNKSQSKK